MSTVYIFCDESGAKGYSDRTESFPGEVGVFAGILVTAEMLPKIAPAFDAIAAKYTPASGKLHIADLPPEQQGALRDDLFAAVRTADLPCFWYAIHVEGIHQFHKQVLARRKAMKDGLRAARQGAAPRVRTGSPREEPKSLHVELFSGLYSHVVAFLLEHNRKDMEVEVRTDQVDAPIVKQFRSVAHELLNTDTQILKVKGFDTVTQEVVERELRINVQLPPELDFNPIVRSLSISTAAESVGLVLAADVLSNSLNYLFGQRTPEELYKPLNRPGAIARHALAEHLNAFVDWGSGDLVGDMLYAHPRAEP